VVQGVGFRPFVYRLACANTLNGWVLNAEEGVEIHLEGPEAGLQAFVRDLKAQPPPAASIAEIEVQPAELVGLQEFTIRTSERKERPTVRISPDLPICDDCLRELFNPADLLEDLKSFLTDGSLQVWTNHAVPRTTEASASDRRHWRLSAASTARRSKQSRGATKEKPCTNFPSR
jgi:acylphosphatase